MARFEVTVVWSFGNFNRIFVAVFKNGMMVFMVLLWIILLEIMIFGAMNGVLEIIISRNDIREFFEFLSRQ